MKDLAKILVPYNLISRVLKNETEGINPVSIIQARLLLNLHKKVAVAKTRLEKEEIICDWLRINFTEEQAPHLYENFTDAISSAKDFRESLIREFVPDTYKFVFTSDGVVRVTNDPIILLETIFDPPGDPFYHEIRTFEALSFFILGLRYMLMKITNKARKVSEHLSSVTLWFEENLFDCSTTAQRHQNLKISFDPKNENRFVGLNHEDLPVIEYPVYARQLKNSNIIILYDGRGKKGEDVFRKTLLLSRGEMPIVYDQTAISLIFLSSEDLEKGRDILTKKVFSNSSMIFDWKINGNGGKKDNKYSAAKSSPEEQFKIFIAGALLEVQIYTFENFFNRRFSLGEENHRYYRLGQVLTLLPLLFPKELFLDWDDLKIQRDLKKAQAARINSTFC